MCASTRQEKAPPPAVNRKRSKHSPRRAFSAAARAFLTLALATCALGAAASAQTISIAPPTNSPNTPEGNTGQTPFEFTVSIDQAPAQDVTVNFTINNGTAVGSASGAGTDFANSVGAGGSVLVDGATAPNNTITFPAGSVVSHIITVPVTGDTLFENDETFSITLSNPTNGASVGGTNPAVATIANDDNRPFISITDAAPVTEGNSGTRNANFTVSLNQASGQDVTFTYNTVVTDPANAGDGNNGSTPDFTPQNNQVGVIQAGQTTTNIAVPIIGDTIDESDGQFLVEISNVNGADIANGQATGTIVDDDGPAVYVSDASAFEGDGQIVFRVQLSAPSPQPITITYRTGSNSATAGLDYGTPGGGEVTGTYTFPAFSGDISTGAAPFVDIPIPIIDDTLSEPTEIFSFTIVSVDNSATLTGPGTRRQATGAIKDNDGSPDLTVQAPQGGVLEGNAGNTPAVFTISLGNPSSQTVSFRYMTVAGTATENQDYQGIGTSRVGTIPAGQTSTTVSVNVIGDLLDEPNETFGLRVFSVAPSGVTVNGSTEQTAFATIIDDDGPSVSVSPTNVTVNEGSNNATSSTAFTIQLSAVSPQDVKVQYTLGGTATRGQDYNSTAAQGVPTTVTIKAGDTTALVPITIRGDDVKEPDETITLTLSNPTGGSIGTNSVGTITIRDDDATPVVSLSADTPSAQEGSNGGVTNFRFRVTLDRASASSVSVNYAVNDGTAVAGPSPAGDFIDPSANGNNVITFNPGTTAPQFITVPVNRDNLNEDDETFSVSLSNAQNARIGVGSASSTIRNDDALPNISIRDTSGLETGDPPPQGQPQGPRILQFLVTLSAPSGKDVTFSYQTTGAGAGNTFTAQSGVDFIPAQGQLTIPAGQLSPTQPLSVTVVADTLDEDNETFGVTINNVTNATIARGGAIGTINDDDNPPTIKIAAPTADNTAVEPYLDSTLPNAVPVNGRNAIFPVTLSTASGRTVTVRYTVSGGANPSAFNNDFLASANDQTRILQTGTLTFTPVNGATPTTQNIVLFPRGDDGDEADVENYVVNITATGANFAAPADATAASTIADRDPNFNNFSPDAGFESFGNGTLGTIITLTGNQFITDGETRVSAVNFTGPTGVAVSANILSITATTITCRIRPGTYTSFVTVVLTSGRVLNSTDPGSRRLFYAQPVVTSFNPTQGVPAVTAVTITGEHFKDPRNPVTAVLFNGVPTTPQNADQGYTVVSDTQILAYVPRDVGSGPISIRTAFGGTGPPSEQTFTVNGFNTGSVRLVAADLTPIYENAEATIRNDNGQILNPVRAFTIQLRPATQNNGNNTPIAPRRTVDVTVTLTAAVPAGNAQILPIIQLDPRVRIDGVTLVRASSNSFTFRIAAGRDPNLTIPVIVTYAGDDTAPPAAQGALSGATDPTTGLTLPVGNSGVQMTLRTEITASNDGELYPVGGFQEVQFERRDIHTFATDTGTALRTTEDQNSPNNRASFAINLANLDFPNPDPFTPNGRAVKNPINDDARPKADVVVSFTSSNTNEGQLTYYVLVNGQKVYPSGANPQSTPIQVIYATSPTRPEYYRNPHYVEVVGQDDFVSDGDQQFNVVATTSTSKDPEYNIPLQLPFVFVNTDNEQGRTGQGFLFSKTNLNTDENGQQDVFTASLRTRPTGNVSISLQSTRVDEVLFVDPNNPTGPGVSSLNITFLASGTGNGKNTTYWQTPIAIQVEGVDDNIRDGDQQALIVTTVIGSADPAYGSIDPPDLIDTNRDNEANGITVTPTTLTINEGATDTFAIRLNARPTSNVTITLFSSDTSIATITSATTLLFTPTNYNTPQTVTVRGVPDGGFAQQRTVTIVTSAASSGDPNFNNLDVADVSVTVLNNDSAFVVNSPAAGLRTSESGINDLFTVSLGQAPTSNVQVILSANPASEARLSRTTSGATPSLTLTFTPTNYANPQTVNVLGQDDTIADGDKSFTITGRVVTSDTVFASQSFPALTGINADNDGGGTGGGGGNATSPTFAANSTYTFSTPYATTTAATSTIPVKSLFTQTATDFKIYRFDVASQKNSRLIGNDFQLVPNTGTIQRGIGYILQTGATALTLKTPTAVKAYSGTGFGFVLSRNLNFVNQTGQTNANNGLNFIGFPFDPSQFGSVALTTALVQVGSGPSKSFRDAVAAGDISDKLYTMNSSGQLTEVPSGSQVLRPYGAYFVRIYRDQVTLTFQSPSAN